MRDSARIHYTSIVEHSVKSCDAQLAVAIQRVDLHPVKLLPVVAAGCSGDDYRGTHPGRLGNMSPDFSRCTLCSVPAFRAVQSVGERLHTSVWARDRDDELLAVTRDGHLRGWLKTFPRAGKVGLRLRDSSRREQTESEQEQGDESRELTGAADQHGESSLLLMVHLASEDCQQTRGFTEYRCRIFSASRERATGRSGPQQCSESTPGMSGAQFDFPSWILLQAPTKTRLPVLCDFRHLPRARCRVTPSDSVTEFRRLPEQLSSLLF
jgi:hypothetical protein